MEGLFTLVMTPLSMRSCSTFSAFFSKGSDTCLVYMFLLGGAPGMSSIFIGLQFIGFGMISSLIMSLDSSWRGRVPVKMVLAFS